MRYVFCVGFPRGSLALAVELRGVSCRYCAFASIGVQTLESARTGRAFAESIFSMPHKKLHIRRANVACRNRLHLISALSSKQCWMIRTCYSLGLLRTARMRTAGSVVVKHPTGSGPMHRKSSGAGHTSLSEPPAVTLNKKHRVGRRRRGFCVKVGLLICFDRDGDCEPPEGIL